MTREIVSLDDGSVLLIEAAPSVTSPAVEGLLSSEIVHFVVDAVVGGVTFDVLKHIAARLSGPKDAEVATAELVRDAVTDYLLRSGYTKVQVRELRQVGTHGWTVEGTADDDPFHALSDPGGRVIHVRLR